MNNDTKRLAACALIVSLPIVLVLASVTNGWALQTLWGWFVVPLGVRPIGIVQAIGIASLVSFLTYQAAKDDEREKSLTQSVLTLLGVIFLRPLVAVGWCALIRWGAS